MTSCPRCEASLAPRGRGLACDAHGIFLDAKALRTAVPFRAKAALDAAAEDAAHATVGCPRCRATMRELTLAVPQNPNVHVDVCLACRGVWFDAHELERLHHVPPPAGASAVPEESWAFVGEHGDKALMLAIDGAVWAAELAVRLALESW